ncbi:sorting nexin-2 [Sparganum proliferum]
MCVQRRFSDFLGLYEKLKEKYLPKGIIIPYPPEKNVIGTTKIRILKNSSADNDFIEKRRQALECFINRITTHPVLRQDPSVIEFLEFEGELPKHSSAQVISGATAKRIIRNVGEAVGKLTFKMDEVDEYFDRKEEEIENWDIQGNRLFYALTNLVADQHELASAAQAFSRSISALANVEEHTGLARALGQLADTEDQITQFHAVQAEAESTYLVEYAKGVLNMMQACRETLSERVKMYKAFKDNESALRGKREQKVRIEMSPKADRAKIPTLEREISELVRRVEDSEDEFETLSSAIKKELEFLDETRFQEFKTAAIGFLNTMLQIQENVLKSWESFLGHAKAIE